MHPLNVRVWQVQSCKKLRGKLPGVASRAGFVWRGVAGEGAWKSPAFFILCHSLPMWSYTVPGKPLQWSVPEQWLAMQLTNTGLHHLGINPPSDHLLQVDLFFFWCTFMPSRITFIEITGISWRVTTMKELVHWQDLPMSHVLCGRDYVSLNVLFILKHEEAQQLAS